MFRPARFWKEFREDLGGLLALLGAGKLKPTVARRVLLADAAQALAEHQRGAVLGKIVHQSTLAA